MDDVANRLVVTIIAGFFVTAVGLVVKREIKILELSKLAQVLRSQISNIWNEPRRIRAEIPIDADDLKPFARYMGALEFVVLMQLSALVTRYYELSQKITIMVPKSDSLYSSYSSKLPDDKNEDYKAITEELSSLRYEIKVIIESVSDNDFRLTSIFPIKIRFWNMNKLIRSSIYSDVYIDSDHVHKLNFKENNNVFQIFSEE